MTYVAIDKYLKEKGKLCFIITQTLFKTQGAGDGFRRFKLGENGKAFKIEQLDDMIEIQPFEGATNRTALFSAIKGNNTIYPVPYILWRKLEKGSISVDLSYKEVFKKTKRLNFKAQPIKKSNTSPWISARGMALKAATKLIGKSYYTAKSGICTWLNSVYWGKIIKLSNTSIQFENIYDVGKIKVKPVSMKIEFTLVYPLLRGREIKKWFSSSNLYIIVSQDPKTRRGYERKWMETHTPRTLEYFYIFYNQLLKRSGYNKYLKGKEFYSIYNVGEYTFAPYKVCWAREDLNLRCAVITKKNDKIVTPDQTSQFIPFGDLREANYVCSLMNSSLANFIAKSYCTDITTRIVNNGLNIPKYDYLNTIHNDLSYLSQQCHDKVSDGIDVTDLEEQIDELAAEMWGLTKQELKDIKESLEELR